MMYLTPLAETGMLCAALTGAPPATEARTVHVSMRYLRPCGLESESAVARSRVLHSGSAFATAEALIEDSLGRAVAHATGSVLLQPIEPGPPPLTAPLRPVEPPLYPTPPPARRPGPRGRVPWRASIRRLVESHSPGEPRPAMLVPPSGQFVGTRVLDLAPGRARIAVPASPWFASLYGSASPALVDFVGEMALALAIATEADPEQRILVNHVALNLLRPVFPVGQELTGQGAVRHRGDVVVCEGEVHDADGTLVAVTQMTCVLRDASAARPVRPLERVLLTVVFTDLVGSTELATRLGRDRWRTQLDDHHALVRRNLDLHRGREIKCTGDGFLATFDSPSRAAAFARAVRDGLDRLELPVRIGIHAGECEVMGSDVGGLVVHVASRIQAAAGPREILVSSTVHDMLAGSGVAFADRGRHALKGVDGEQQLFAVTEPDGF
jgi:class 3 adenylate cyclase